MCEFNKNLIYQILRGNMKADHLLFRIAIATLLLCSISLGGLDQSGNSGAENLTISEFNALVPAGNLEERLC